MSTPVPDSARARHLAALDDLEAHATPGDRWVARAIETGRALEAELAGSDPLFADPSTADPPGASTR